MSFDFGLGLDNKLINELCRLEELKANYKLDNAINTYLPQHISALVHVSGKVKILDHEGDVAIPGLV